MNMTMDEISKQDDDATEAAIARDSRVIKAFLQVVKESTTDEPGMPIQEIWSQVVAGLSPEQRAEAVFQFLGDYINPVNGGSMTKAGKIFAIELADTMGPDYTQGVYQFGVAVSRA